MNGTGAAELFSNTTTYTVLLDSSGTGFKPIGSTFSTTGILYNPNDGGVTSGIQHTVTIPATLHFGTNYRILLNSDNPSFAGSTGLAPSPAFTISKIDSIRPGIKGNVSACGITDDGFVSIRVFPRENGIAKPPQPYVFTLDGTVTSPTSDPSVAFIFSNLAEGLHTITVTDAAGCTSSFTGRIGKDLPVVTKVGTVVNQSCAKNGYLTAFALDGNGHYRYSITKEGGTASAPQTGHLFTNLEAGTYLVTSDTRGCADPTPVTATILPPKYNCPPAIAASSGSNNLIAKNSLSLLALPNPTRTAFTLNLQSSSKERVQIIVTDLSGKKLYQATGNSNRQYTFGREFASGMYIVQVIQGKDIKTLKLIKEN